MILVAPMVLLIRQVLSSRRGHGLARHDDTGGDRWVCEQPARIGLLC
jgi:hypothetical protein